uniref:Uncharacterized protein n=1 Tax=Panagrolaimus davidi TaxID=227884 RepID=A0A914PA19_9BILA
MSTQESSTLSAAERRQRRKERILGTADSRLEKLLPGSISSSVEMTQPADEFDRYNSSSSTDITPEDSSPEQIFKIVGKTNSVGPSFVEVMAVNRVQVCIAIGIIFRVLTLFDVVHSILPLWIPLSVGYYSYLLSHASTKISLPGQIMNLLHGGGISGKAVQYFSMATDTLWSFSNDTMIMAFGFLISHIIISAVNHMYLTFL